eukprot:GILJ01002781.1.p1 GENE.GILJ01002781.1~~GILJ01002781.1.p1  ORF type:complete len:201 (+),score=11.67 GILJ01002781.1:891-1493(+)
MERVLLLARAIRNPRSLALVTASSSPGVVGLLVAPLGHCCDSDIRRNPLLHQLLQRAKLRHNAAEVTAFATRGATGTTDKAAQGVIFEPRQESGGQTQLIGSWTRLLSSIWYVEMDFTAPKRPTSASRRVSKVSRRPAGEGLRRPIRRPWRSPSRRGSSLGLAVRIHLHEIQTVQQRRFQAEPTRSILYTPVEQVEPLQV